MDAQEQQCEHSGVHWYLDPCTEAGWRCLDCDTHLGYRPDLDREQTYRKVSAVLHELHQHEVVYLSNAQEGDIVTTDVAYHCRDVDVYDQWSITRFILAHPALEHSTFWRDEAHKWLAEHQQKGAAHSGTD